MLVSRNKLLLSLIVVSFCIWFFSRKKQKSESFKTLSISLPAKIKSFDPIRANDEYSSQGVALAYEGLLEYHYLERPYKLIPNLAVEMPKVLEDESGRPIYIFKIKKGVLFQQNPCFKSSNRELIAKDVEYSIKRLASLQSLGFWMIDGKILGLNEWRENLKKGLQNFSNNIPGIEIIDKYTIKFTLTGPYTQFLHCLANPHFYIVAKEAVDHYGDNFNFNPVGSGPFVLKTTNPQALKLIFDKNQNYRGRFPKKIPKKLKYLEKYAGKKLPFMDRLIVHIIQEPVPRWLKFMKKGIDIIDAIPKDNFSQAITKDKKLTPEMKQKGIKLKFGERSDLVYLAFNHNNPIFSKNVKLKQAIALAYSNRKVASLFYNDMGRPAQSLLVPGIDGYDKKFINPYRVYDLEKAKKLLSEAGYPNGVGLPELEISVRNATFYRQLGEHFQQSMKKLGIKIKIITNTYPELLRRRSNGTMTIFNMIHSAIYPDAQSFLQLLYGPNKSPGINGSNFDNIEYNILYDKALTLPISEERTLLYKKMNDIATENVPLLYLVHRLHFVLHHENVRNYIISDFSPCREKYLDKV